MRVIMKFDWYEDKDLLMAMMKATDTKLVIYDLLQAFREVWKYGENQTEIDQAERWRDKLLELLEDREISLD